MRLSKLWQLAFSERYLLATNVVINCTLLSGADFFQQWINEPQVDWNRNYRVSTMGFILAPMNHYWYKFIERVVPGRPTSALVVAKKVALDCASCPLFSGCFVNVLALREGKTPAEAWEDYRKKFLRIMALDMSIWPAAEVINFRFLSLRYRLLYVCCVQFLYSTIMTYIKHSRE